MIEKLRYRPPWTSTTVESVCWDGRGGMKWWGLSRNIKSMKFLPQSYCLFVLNYALPFLRRVAPRPHTCLSLEDVFLPTTERCHKARYDNKKNCLPKLNTELSIVARGRKSLSIKRWNKRQTANEILLSLNFDDDDDVKRCVFDDHRAWPRWERWFMGSIEWEDGLSMGNKFQPSQQRQQLPWCDSDCWDL